MATTPNLFWRIWPATAAFAFEHGSDDLPYRFKLWFGKRRSTCPSHRGLRRIDARQEEARVGKATRSASGRRPPGATSPESCKPKSGARGISFSPFATFPGEVKPTNNTSERKLRPCVIQRKVTNGYRADVGRPGRSDVRTTIDTARLSGANPFNTISPSWLDRAANRYHADQSVGVGNCVSNPRQCRQ